MQVTVRMFAAIREAARTDSLTVEVAAGSTAQAALDAAYREAGVDDRTRTVPVVLAVNREQVQATHVLAAGDEVAVLPPVSGGAGTRVHAAITGDVIDDRPLHQFVADDRAGAIVAFSGVTREVQALDYEAYAEMAQARLTELLTQAGDSHGLCAIAAVHRTGRVPLGESSVVVVASSPHREAAFSGAREAIDRIKVELPVWKLELNGDGAGRWVQGSPMERTS